MSDPSKKVHVVFPLGDKRFQLRTYENNLSLEGEVTCWEKKKDNFYIPTDKTITRYSVEEMLGMDKAYQMSEDRVALLIMTGFYDGKR